MYMHFIGCSFELIGCRAEEILIHQYYLTETWDNVYTNDTVLHASIT